jgi:flagellar biosynthesis chaperone FliJ
MNKLTAFINKIITFIKTKKMTKNDLKVQAWDMSEGIKAKAAQIVALQSQISVLQSELPTDESKLDDLRNQINNFVEPVITETSAN